MAAYVPTLAPAPSRHPGGPFSGAFRVRPDRPDTRILARRAAHAAAIRHAAAGRATRRAAAPADAARSGRMADPPGPARRAGAGDGRAGPQPPGPAAGRQRGLRAGRTGMERWRLALAAVRAGGHGGRARRRARARRGTPPALPAPPLDALLSPAALERQRQAVRDGHCGLLPEPRVPGMARVQVARDLSMAQTAAAAQRPGKVVLVVAGAAHVKRSLGVPVHLPENMTQKVVIAHTGIAEEAIKSEANLLFQTPDLPPDDACAPLRQIGRLNSKFASDSF